MSAMSDNGDEELGGGLVATAAPASRVRLGKVQYVGLNSGVSDDTSEMSSIGSGDGREAYPAVENTPDKASGRLAIFGLLNLGYVVLQLAGAMAFSSLALMSDGFHNLSDVAAIGMAMYIHRLQRRRCPENEEGGTDQLPFGYKRSEVIGGLMNSVTLIALSAYITLSAIPRLFVPTEVTDGWAYILLAFGGVLVNLVGVLFFLYTGEQTHDCSGFLTAHNHCHSHGDEVPATLDSMGLLTLVDRYEVVPTPASPSECPVDGGEEVSIVLAGSDPIGRLSLRDTAAARQAFLGGDDAESCDEEGGWVGGGGRGGGDSGGRGNALLRQDKKGQACCPHAHSHSHGGHAPVNEEVHQADGSADHSDSDEAGSTSPPFHSKGMDACCRHGSALHGVERSHDHADSGHTRAAGAFGSGGIELERIPREHGPAAVGGGGGESHEHVHGPGCSHGQAAGGGHGHVHSSSCSHGRVAGGGQGHVHSSSCSHGRAAGVGGGCTAHGGKSMNLTAVLVHAIVDTVSSGVVCAQGIVAYIFGKPSAVDWTDYLDPLTSILLSVFIVYYALPVVKECAHVLLEGTPRSTDMPRLKRELLKVRGIFSVQSLSVTQLNSEEPFVASVTLVADAGAVDSATRIEGGDRGHEKKGKILEAGTEAVVESVRRVLATHNIGRNTVEIVQRPVGPMYGAAEKQGKDWAGLLPAAQINVGGRDEVEAEERKHLVEAGRHKHSNGHTHAHGKCSGDGHAHATAVDLA